MTFWPAVELALALVRLANAIVARLDRAALVRAGREAALLEAYEKGASHVGLSRAVDRAVLGGDDPDWVRRVRERYAAPAADD